MRVNPSVKALKGNEVSPEQKAKIEKLTRLVALIVALIGTYIFVFKILFF